jgi:hypothetical protein
MATAAAFASPALAAEDSILMRVGKTEVHNSELTRRALVESCYREGRPVDEVEGFLLLLQEGLDMEMARILGIPPTEEEIDDLARHVSDTTRAKDILNAVKKVFGEDKEAYRRVFLAPKVADRKLRATHSAEEEKSGRGISYDDWRRDRVLEIKVEVYDHYLLEKVEEAYPNLWWLERLEYGKR